MLERTSKTQTGSLDNNTNAILYCNAAAQDLQVVPDIEMKQFARIDQAIFNGSIFDTNATI